MSAIPHLTDAVLVTGGPTHQRQADLAVMGFLARYRVPHTRYVYGIALRQWFEFCDTHFVDPLAAQRAHIEIWARLLEENGNQLSTVAGKLNALAGFYRYTFADGLIDRDPMVHVRRPQIQRESTTNGLTRTELADMLNLAESTSHQDNALLCVLGLNGLRVSEATGIDLEHFGRHRGQTTVQILRKGNKRQIVPFAYRTAWAVEQLIGDRTIGPLFLTREGNRLDRKAAGRIVKRIALACGITRRIHPHSLRHTFVTLARDAGVSDRDIIASTGHSDGRMVEYYDRGRDKIERNATNAVASFVERAG